MATKGQKFRSWTEDEKNQILEMYVGGAKIREISVLFKASIGTIGTILHTTRTIGPINGSNGSSGAGFMVNQGIFKATNLTLEISLNEIKFLKMKANILEKHLASCIKEKHCKKQQLKSCEKKLLQKLKFAKY